MGTHAFDSAPSLKPGLCPYCSDEDYQRILRNATVSDDGKELVVECTCMYCGNNFREFFQFDKMEKGV